jgi:hypothetical protein
MREELMEKERYETPLMDVVWFEAEDVITTSTGDNETGNFGSDEVEP